MKPGLVKGKEPLPAIPDQGKFGKSPPKNTGQGERAPTGKTGPNEMPSKSKSVPAIKAHTRKSTHKRKIEDKAEIEFLSRNRRVEIIDSCSEGSSAESCEYSDVKLQLNKLQCQEGKKAATERVEQPDNQI